MENKISLNIFLSVIAGGSLMGGLPVAKADCPPTTSLITQAACQGNTPSADQSALCGEGSRVICDWTASREDPRNGACWVHCLPSQRNSKKFEKGRR